VPRIAEAAAKIAAAFADYCAEFRAITRRSKTRFEAMEWQTHERDALERLELYGRFMEDLKPEMRALLGDLAEDRRIWAGIKSAYAEQADARNFELARTFFNSITRRVFGTVGVNRDRHAGSGHPGLGARAQDPARAHRR
jgi:isocitrate dehydrogenase kinase/phosphatase